MPNEYSIEIHNYLTEQIAIQEQRIKEMDDSTPSEDRRYNQGRVDELFWLRKYLADNVDLKDFTYY